jgi:TolB-like protein/Flp pilus assembly protein TadD
MSESAGKAVFLSYASQDAEAAKRICEALRAAGVEVWFDQDALVGGDAWDGKIRGQIQACALFLPIISANTQARAEGYFRREWKLAAERTHDMADHVAFLVPVVIDGTKDREAHVPEKFRAVQWTKLPGGEASTGFVTRVQKLLGGPSAPTATPAPVPPPATPVAPAARTGLPHWVGIALGLVVLALIGFLVMRPGAKDAGPVAKPVAETKPALASFPAPAANDKSIAVLPFTNLSDEKENTAFFSDGMHEDILTTLANIPELRVVSRTSVMEYRGTTKKIPQIARELNVAYILEGSARRAGNQIRLTGQLIRAATDEHLWAKNYDRELTPKDMFAVQAALATEIANALQAAISPAAHRLLERRATENLAAYDLYLRARSLDESRQGAAKVREKFLQGAVDLDAGFAAAWGELAANHAGFVYWDWDHTPQRLAQAEAAIARAVRLAPDAPEVITMLGRFSLLGFRDYPRAAAQFEKVIQLQPNNSEGYVNLGYVRRRQGRWLEALENFRKAGELDRGKSDNVIAALVAARRWTEAIAEQQRIIAWANAPAAQLKWAQIVYAATGSTKAVDDLAAQLTAAQRHAPEFIPLQKAHAQMRGDFVEWKRLDALANDGDQAAATSSEALHAATMLAANGDRAGARTRLGHQPAQLRSTLELQPANARLWRELAMMEALLGENESALRNARKAVDIMPESRDAADGPRYRLNLARVQAWTGDKAGAVAELARVLRVPFGIFESGSWVSVHTLRGDPAFAPLRGDPRFEALLNDPKNNEPLF